MHTKALSTKTYTLATAIAVMAMVSVGCAITDYRGYLGHMTESEAKLWGSQSAVSGDPRFTGTYEYTVKYDFRGTGTTVPTGTYPDEIDIFTYRNPTAGAFSRDGCVDRDGDELQQRPGVQPPFFRCDAVLPSATKFEPLWEFEDRNFGCQFIANYEKTYGNAKPLLPIVQLCFNTPVEEVDKDLSLQGAPSSNLKEAFASLDDLVAKIWSGGLGNPFTMNATSVTLNGTEVALGNPAAFSAGRNDFRVINGAFDTDNPGVQDIIRAILNNTQDGVPATVAVQFEGGLRLSQPSVITVVFDHDELVKLLN